MVSENTEQVITMCVLNVIFFTVALGFLCERLGGLLQTFGTSDPLFVRLVNGFIGLVAAFHVAAVPLILFHLPFGYAYVFFLMIVIAVLVLSFKIHGWKVAGFAWLKNAHVFRDIFFGATLAVALLLILLQAGVSAYLSCPNADDSFYVSLINTTLNAKAMFVCDPSTGNPDFPVMAQYVGQTWEVLQAVLAKMFMIRPAALAHTVLPFFLILISYCSYASLGRLLVPNRYIPIFLILLSLFHLMGGYSVYSQGSFLLLRIWQGKAVVLHILMPFFWASIIRFVKDDYANRHIVSMLVVALAGIALNPVAVYLLPMILGGMIVSDLMMRRMEAVKGWKVLVVLVPLALAGLLIRVEASDTFVFTNPVTYSNFKSLQILKDFMGRGGLFFMLYIAGAVYLWFTKHVAYRRLFLLAPLVLVLTVWNPVFAPAVARYVTSYPTYWRVFWLLPLGVGLATCVVAASISGSRISAVVFGSLYVLVLVCGGRVVYEPGRCLRPENALKIPWDVAKVTEFIASRDQEPGFVLAPAECSTTMRQMSSKVRLFWSRTLYGEYFLLSRGKVSEFQQRTDLFAFCSSGTNMPAGVVRSQLKHFGIDWVIMSCDTYVKCLPIMKDLNVELAYSNATYAALSVLKE